MKPAVVEGRLAGVLDSHAHLDMGAFDADREAVLARAREAGLRAVITIGVERSPEGIEKAVSLAEAHDAVFATVGVHPHDASCVAPEWMERIRALTRRPEVVGVGETGLDYHYLHSPADVQREVFGGFLRLGRETGLPVVVHSREADEDTVEVMREAGRGPGGELHGVVHCFSGDYAQARRYLDMGFHLSFTGVVTFPKAGALRDVVSRLPLDRILLETDCPYLAPAPHRGRRNEPALVVHVAEAVARALGRRPEEVAEVTTRNAVRLFRLPLPVVV